MNPISRRSVLTAGTATAGAALLTTSSAHAATGWVTTCEPDAFSVRVPDAPAGSRLRITWTDAAGSHGPTTVYDPRAGWWSGPVPGLVSATILLISMRNKRLDKIVLTPTAPAPTPSGGGKRIGWTIANPDISEATPLMSTSYFASELDKVVASGAGWVRIGLPMWVAGGFYGPNSDQWFPRLDYLATMRDQLASIRSRELKTALTITEVHCRAVSTPDFFAANRIAMDEIVNAIGSLVDVWQITNEANMDDYRYSRPFPVDTEPRPGYYTELDSFLAMARAAIKRKYPSAIVTTTFGGYPSDEAQWNRWADRYASATTYLDAWGVNAYPGRDWPEQIEMQTQWCSAFKARAGRPVYVFETGLSAENASIEELAKTSLPSMIASLSSAADLVMVYQLSDQPNATGLEGERHFGIYYADGRPKPYRDAAVAAIAKVSATVG